MSNQQRDKEAQTQEVDDRERDATMAPTVTKAIFHYLSDDDQEDHPITKKLRTAGSFQINDCNLMIKNVSDATVDPRDLVHEAILEKVRNEEPIITNEERIEDHTLQLTAKSGGQMITSTKREKFFSKRLTKYDLNRSFGGGLKLPLKLVTDNILVHISAPADGDEGKPLTLVDHEGGKWDMLFVLKSKKYYLRGEWYNYVEKYELKDSDTIIIEKITISKEQVKEVVGFAAVNQIGDHDWDTICKDQQIETKDIGKAEVAYEITIERGPENTVTEQEDDDSGDEE
ncbi:uncharacterized protein [Nicotiana sylvestris]|uniref:Uncharacterized protein LOC104239105 n=1 Tax=Nicotiana sylvestris TaxID=4096 RepID=A0A1U7XM16_NICSY|nr:PREDICTED: uncharacterized protein LOC104239105 [Nicotiana sylvestris]